MNMLGLQSAEVHLIRRCLYKIEMQRWMQRGAIAACKVRQCLEHLILRKTKPLE